MQFNHYSLQIFYSKSYYLDFYFLGELSLHSIIHALSLISEVLSSWF